MATLLPASALPERVGVLSLVTPPLTTLPVTGPTSSLAPVMTGAAVTVSTTSENGAEGWLWLPAGSVAVMSRV